MKMVIWTLIGAAIGVFGMNAVLSFDSTAGFPPIGFEADIVLLAITVILLIFSTVSMVQMKKKSQLDLTGDKEDERDVWQYKRFSDVSLCTAAALVLSILAAAVAIITVQPAWILIISGVAFMVSALLSVFSSGLVNSLYPERNLPSPSDKNYAEKLLAASDEGEQFVMLQGLYKTFSTMNLTLLMALLVFIGYSVITGDSQLFSIFVIGLVLIGTNAQYLITIRNK
ncbi:DUF3169 family protein [Sporosarcina sp. P33]|uniref:DUF3169 family protein n=1 Tax=Sporosarcina sp. P33 TaxID=1930764 RepID=UPI0009BF4676|nr:DUF3169 family protein [Sporosarcina sp. P33]ARD49485.1 hypothetical protein SporoP33_15300 [Sporosarcina sp. P33]